MPAAEQGICVPAFVAVLPAAGVALERIVASLAQTLAQGRAGAVALVREEIAAFRALALAPAALAVLAHAAAARYGIDANVIQAAFEAEIWIGVRVGARAEGAWAVLRFLRFFGIGRGTARRTAGLPGAAGANALGLGVFTARLGFTILAQGFSGLGRVAAGVDGPGRQPL